MAYDLKQVYGAAEQAAVPAVPAAPDSSRTGYADTENLRNLMDQKRSAAQAQAQASVDWSTAQAVNELARTRDAANAQYETQQNQINIGEARAKDNQALYNEMRGDRGGIGAAQYDAIMNTASANRQAVRLAQTAMATDTARQMTELRARGEYEKADALLQLTQQYLTELADLEKWAMQYNLDVDQFNARKDQWQAEYNTKLRQMELSQDQWEQQMALNREKFAWDQQTDQREYDLKQERYAVEDARKAEENARKAEETAYQRQQQALTNQVNQEKLDLSRESAAQTQSNRDRQYYYTLAMALIRGGVKPDSNTLSAAGISDSAASAMAASYREQAAAKTASSSSSSKAASGGSSQSSAAKRTASTASAKSTGSSAASSEKSAAITQESQLGQEAQTLLNTIRKEQNRQKRQGGTPTGLTPGWSAILDRAVSDGRITKAERSYILKTAGWS